MSTELSETQLESIRKRLAARAKREAQEKPRYPLPQGYWKWSAELTPMDKFVKYSMLKYPTICQTRTAVLLHAFVVIGNGLSWDNGVLVDRYDSRSEDITEINRDSLKPYDLFKTKTKGKKDDIEKLYDEAEQQRLVDEGEWLDHQEKNINFLCRRQWQRGDGASAGSGHYENPIVIVNDLTTTKYTRLASMLKEAYVEPSFLAGAIEAIDYCITWDYNEEVPEFKRTVDMDTARYTLYKLRHDLEWRVKNLVPWYDIPPCSIHYPKDPKEKDCWWYSSRSKSALESLGFKEHTGSSNGSGYVSRSSGVKIDDTKADALDAALKRRSKDFIRVGPSVWYVQIQNVYHRVSLYVHEGMMYSRTVTIPKPYEERDTKTWAGGAYLAEFFKRTVTNYENHPPKYTTNEYGPQYSITDPTPYPEELYAD